LGALLLADADVALDPVQLFGGDQRAHVRGLVGRRADVDALGDLDQAGDHLVVDRAGHQQAAARGTDLALMEEDGVDRPVDREVEIGVLEDDVGRLAAEFDQHLLDGAAASAWTCLPPSVEPVNATLSTCGEVTSGSPASGPNPGRTLTTPSGTPAPAQSPASSTAVHGVCSAGLSTMVLPAARAGATFQAAFWMGKFQGTMPAQTPTGSRRT